MMGLNSDDINQLRFWAGSTVYSNYEIKEDGLRKQVAYTKSGSVGTFYVNGVAVATVTGTAGTDG